MWSSMRVIWLFKCCPSGHRTLSRTTATASSCLTFLDNFRVFDGWILFGTFISQTAWRPGHEAKGAKVNVIRCYLWHHYLPPGRQIKSFVGLSRCNWLWHGLLLWLERKTEGLKHIDCIPYSGVGFFRTWYWESKSVIKAFEKIEQFDVFMHEENSAVTTVNAARQKLFSQRSKLSTHIFPQSTKAAMSVRLGMYQRRRTTTEATMDNTSSGWGLVLGADPLWLETRP